MKRKSMLACMLCLLLLMTMLSGCAKEEAGTGSTQSSENTRQTETVPAPDGAVVITTPYGNLYYQDQWLEYMRTEVVVGKETIRVAFHAVINETTYPLFTVTVGGDEEGAVGQLTDAEGTKRNVYVNMEQTVVDSQLTEGEQNRLYAMREEINYVMQNLK